MSSGLRQTYFDTQEVMKKISIVQSELKLALQSLAQDKLEPVQQLIATSQDNALVLFLKGKLSLRIGDVKAAMQFYAEAVALAPKNNFFLMQLAALAFELGERSLAYQTYKLCASRNPTNGTAARMQSLLWEAPGPEDDAIIQRGRAATAAQNGSARIEMLYAAARLRLDQGRPDRSFPLLAEAGAMQKRLHPWDPSGMKRLADALIAKVDNPWLVEKHDQGDADQRPIFIVGMPRSGTTLVESILAAHPSVATIGESHAAENALNGIGVKGTRFETSRRSDKKLIALSTNPTLSERGKHYIEQAEALAPSAAATRILDKFPGNYMWLGLIHSILPAARFIHCARHPADSSLSQYLHYFGTELPYSYNLRDLAEAYLNYDRVMKHWQAVLPLGSLITIRYEQLVEEFEPSVRRIVSFCGLPWSEACLQPHARTARVKTASAVQVKQPVHRASVGAWKKYASHLKPLTTVLGDHVDNYDDHWPKFTKYLN